MADHNPRVRGCIVITNPPLPGFLLRDDIRCPACDDLHRLMHLDPDVTEVLSREPWCESCIAVDKPLIPAATPESPSKPSAAHLAPLNQYRRYRGEERRAGDDEHRKA